MQTVSNQVPVLMPRFGNDQDQPSKVDALKAKAHQVADKAKETKDEVVTAVKQAKDLSPEERTAALSQVKEAASEKAGKLVGKAKSAFAKLTARFKKED